jgi:cytochrome P450
MTPTRPAYDPVSLAPLSFWAKSAAEKELDFRVLRDERPVSWHPPAEGSMLPPPEDGGFWGITRHADVLAVSKRPKDFRSGQGVLFEEIPEEVIEASSSFLAMDAPRHTQLRKLVSSAFTPRQIARINTQVENQSRRLVDRLIDIGDCDFVAEVSRKLPQWTIYEMIGLPEDLRDAATDGADGMISWADEDVRAGREPLELIGHSLMTLTGIALDLATDRRAQPRDDLMTNLVQAEVDGQRLSDQEIAAFFVLLSVGGNDTTRNSTSVAMRAFTEFPGQRWLLRTEFDQHVGTAVEEIVRWASPVMTFRRTATRDLDLHGQHIRAGDWVILFYASANHDDRAFTNPSSFDVTRHPNPHVGFGGGGPHFCLGAMLARTQLRCILDQLLHRVPNLEVGQPTRLVGNFMNAIKSMPCQLNLARAPA